MTGEREHLLAAVAAHPADDLPRLVFADWLDEQGGDADASRAEFIRHQVGQFRAFSPVPLAGPQVRASEWHPTWPAAWSEGAGDCFARVAHERGFPKTLVKVGLTPGPPGMSDLQAHPDPELRLVSRLEHSDLHESRYSAGPPDGPAATRGMEWRGGMMTAWVGATTPDGTGMPLALEELILMRPQSPDELSVLAAARGLGPLRHLDIQSDSPADAGVLADAALPRLCHLGVTFRGGGDPPGAEWLAAPLLGRLETLSLTD